MTKPSRILLTLAVLTTAQAGAGDLTVAVNGIRSGEGEIRLMLFDREEGFRKEDKARQKLALPAVAGTVNAVFPGLPAGRYAVMVYHDENGNGKLDLRFGMFPKEGYGLSTNPKPLGPPKFKDAAFEVADTDSRIDIRLDY
ncbi:MAG: DUF2141 domain-containing protein [Gammaproteobacteria bacterium]|nr:DUF2141 domain-containing protein [Gammaproteobacteria bacterium]